MKELKKHFTGTGEVKGNKFTQINCTNRAFMYEVNTGHSIYYEVFKRTINKRFACVSYPSANYFGIWGWVYLSYDEAVEKFNTL